MEVGPEMDLLLPFSNFHSPTILAFLDLKEINGSFSPFLQAMNRIEANSTSNSEDNFQLDTLMGIYLYK
jgi:hypothetical protein